MVTAASIEPVARMTRDLRESARLLGRAEARYLVDIYYTVQEYRKRSANQVRASKEGDEPHEIIVWSFDTFERVELQIKRALGIYAQSHTPGVWALSIHGIGPVIAAGLLAHIDIEKANTAGKVWRFAGQDHSIQWLGSKKAQQMVKETLDGSKMVNEDALVRLAERGPFKLESLRRLATTKAGKITPASLAAALAKRPWNAQLKRLCWIIGDSFVKQRASEKDFYGGLYEYRKAVEVRRNTAGEFRATAERTLAERKIRDKALRETYEAGRLPDGRIDLRARVWAVKLFLAHYQHVAYECHYHKAPPNPYVIEHLGHVGIIGPPNWPMK